MKIQLGQVGKACKVIDDKGNPLNIAIRDVQIHAGMDGPTTATLEVVRVEVEGEIADHAVTFVGDLSEDVSADRSVAPTAEVSELLFRSIQRKMHDLLEEVNIARPEDRGVLTMLRSLCEKTALRIHGLEC